MFCVIDTDILLYKATTTCEKSVDWGDDIWSLWCDLKDAKALFQKQCDEIAEATGITDHIHCLSDHGNNFRKVVDPRYKSQRKGTRKPCGYVAMSDWVEENYKTYRLPTTEADEVMGILATKPENKGKCVVVSDDKDLKTIPGKLYRPTLDEKMDITEQEANRYFLTQCLTGDSTDGYVGIPGVGPKAAERLLGGRPDWSVVQREYVKAGMTRDDAIQQARLARILHWDDWDEEKGEVILWEPPSASQ